MVINHIGLYGDLSKEQAMANVLKNVRYLKKRYKELKLKPKLGFEVSGKQALFGDLGEILTLVKKARGILPIINFAHLHARENGKFKEPKDFVEVLDKVESYMKGHHYVEFSGVEYENGNELRLTPIKKGDLKFETFANALYEHEYDITIISSSPLLEHDAAYMRAILERVVQRKMGKKGS